MFLGQEGKHIPAWFLGFAIAVCALTQLGATSGQAPTKQKLTRISFRTIKKTSLHLNSEKEVAETEKVLKQLGCETSRSQHNGHIDLSFECPYWRSLNLKDQAEATKWVEWLTKHKFALVENTPPSDHKETVQYQLATWRALHNIKDSKVKKAYTEMFKMLGCEVKMVKHSDHEDITYRCVNWQNMGLASHQLAHAWMAELNKLGFVTKHEH